MKLSTFFFFLIVSGYLLYQVQSTSQMTFGDVISGNIKPLEIVNSYCSSCESNPFLFGQYRMDALTLEATYLVKRRGAVAIAFAKGVAKAGEDTLEPGCHTLRVDAGARLVFDASDVHISFPAQPETCQKLSSAT